MIFDFSNQELFNPIYLPLFHDKNRYKILYGGRDSGKSDFVAQFFIISALKEKFFRGLLIRKFYDSIRASQFQTLIDYIRLWDLSQYFHITQNPITITCVLNGNMILAKGLDKPDNTKSIKDPTCAWYEEADQINESAFIDTTLTLRSSKTEKIFEFITFNPRREQSWLASFFFPPKQSYERPDGNFHWVKSPRNNVTILHTTYKDNRFCPKERAETLEALKNHDENLYKVNTLGLWGGAMRGLIYPDWVPTDEFPYGRGDEVFGLDYGLNNPTALVHLSFFENKLYINECIYVTKHTHRQVINLMVSDFKNIIGKKIVVVDSEEPALIKELRLAGFNSIPSFKGPNSVYHGIMLARQFDFYITKRSTNIINEIQSYKWKEDKDGRIIDEPVKVDDHAMDAIRYAIQTYGVKYWKRPSTKDLVYRLKKKEDKFVGY
ncbi:MAG: PBSX family phage terminase large subunit [Ignavibacteria bacterium]|nr:PBSX family phage terminase large subunit [Ignavibacteria bacterium]